MSLYGECIKPKLHYLRHLPGMIHKFGINLTCFSMELHHRQNKTLATFLYRNIGDVILRRVLCVSLAKLKDPEALHTLLFLTRGRGSERAGRVFCVI